jgi:hypothetical protein
VSDFVMLGIVDAVRPKHSEPFAPIYIALLFSGRLRRSASSLHYFALRRGDSGLTFGAVQSY